MAKTIPTANTNGDETFFNTLLKQPASTLKVSTIKLRNKEADSTTTMKI